MSSKIAYYVEVYNLENFARLVCALERTPYPVFSFIINGERIMAISFDYYNENPIFYYTRIDNSKKGHYIGYKINNSYEDVKIVDGISNPSYIFSPIINIDKLPLSFARRKRLSKKNLLDSFQIRDISDLARMASYKTVFDEPPLPIYIFKGKKNNLHSNHYIIGTMVIFNESQPNPIFMYLILDKEPAGPFIRYSSQKPESTSFSSNINEHGYTYLKLVRLSKGHPLVDLNE